MNPQSLTLALGGRWYGSYGSAKCPAHRDTRPSLTIRPGNKVPALLFCNSGCDQAAVVDALKGRGLWPGKGESHQPDFEETEARRKARLAKDQSRIDYADKLWRECKPIADTIAETYLRSRRITTDLPETLRYHPCLKHTATGLYLPAMVAVVQDVDGKLSGLHRTFLRENGNGKATISNPKMLLGLAIGCAVRLGPVADEIGISEGIETGLSFQQETGIPTWPAISTAGMNSIELPQTVRSIIVVADNGTPGENAAQALGKRMVMQGRRARIARPPKACSDFNDVLFLE